MSIEEYVKTSREEQRRRFGENGLKKDCVHHTTKHGKNKCNACMNVHGYSYLQCERNVCYFYDSKRKDETNDS